MNRAKEIKEWLKERKTYIGGSDIGCILGLSPYRTPLDIFLDKTTDRIDEATSEAAYWGTVFEDLVAREYSRRTGFEVEEAGGLIRHPEHGFLAANIDRWVAVAGRAHVLECKTVHFLKGREWGGEGSDEIPELYLCQVAYYAAICNVRKVDIAVLIRGQDFRIYTYVKNREFEDRLIRAACAFWNNYVLKGVAPKASNVEDVLALYPKSNGNAVQADRETVKDIEELKSVRLQEKILAEIRAVLETKIKACIADNETLIDHDGKVLASWRSGKARQVLDIQKLQTEHRDICRQYLTEKEAGRTFLVK